MSTENHSADEQPKPELLEWFPNPAPQRDYTLHIEVPEFTCLCPRSGMPDFAVLEFDYVPEARCVELKSLKLYIRSYRSCGAFHEEVSNHILEHLCTLLSPRFLRLRARFHVRGGIYTTVIAEHRAPGWNPLPRIELP